MAVMQRYSEVLHITSHLDPLSDVISWIRGLKSIGYTQDLLRVKHGFTIKNEIQTAARQISAYVDTAVGLLEQCETSPIEISYLPAYYAMLNLAKATVIFGGNIGELSKPNNRFHGAAMGKNRKKSQNLLTDEFELHDGGAMPLFYKTLVGKSWIIKKGHKKRVIKLGSIYPYILDIQHEFFETYKIKTPFDSVITRVEQVNLANYFRFVVNIRDLSQPSIIINDKQEYKILSGLMLENNSFVSSRVKANSPEDAEKKLRSQFPDYLMYSYAPDLAYTPRSKSNLLLPEEIPILFAFFHLSNIVRYDPIALKRLFDSPAIPVLEALARHAKLKYLKLFWGYVNKKVYFINSYVGRQ